MGREERGRRSEGGGQRTEDGGQRASAFAEASPFA